MGVIDLSAYKPVPSTLGDANQVANGFQALQNLLNGSIDNNNFAAGKIFDPAKLMQNAAIDGDPLVWDNSLVKWVPASTLAAGRPRAPRVIVSTMAGGPPASPVDQDIWIATAVDANGLRWAFQYNAGSASAFKWETIGNIPVHVEVDASEATSSAAFVNLATVGPQITLARPGDYYIEHGARMFGPENAGVGFFAIMSYDVGGTAAVDVDGVVGTNSVNNAGPLGYSTSRRRRKNLATATMTLTAKYRSTAGTQIEVSQRWMSVTPIRIS